jgi:PAS domain S-box-containing protein
MRGLRRPGVIAFTAFAVGALLACIGATPGVALAALLALALWLYAQHPGRSLLALQASSAPSNRPEMLAPKGDDTDQGALHAKLAASQTQNEALLRTLDLHSKMSITDRSGVIIEVNDNFCRISGYSRGELVGQPHNILNSGVHSDKFWSDMWRTIDDGRAWRGEICNRSKDGSLHWVDSIVAPLPGHDGLPDRFISIRTDITSAKMTEQRLRASETFLDRTGRIAGIGGWQFDIGAARVEWSAHMNRLHDTTLDYGPSLEEGLNFYALESRPTIRRALDEAMQSGKGWDLELAMITATGRAIWVRSVCTVECVDGRPVRLMGSTQDITAHKETERSLTYERDLMASLLETLPDRIYFKDKHCRFLRVNSGTARFHGMKNVAEAVGKSEADYLPQAHAQRSVAIEQGIMNTGEAVLELEEQTIWPDRPATWSLSTKMPLYDADDRIVGTFGISRDITKRKIVEAQLQQTSTRFAIAADAAGIGVWEFDAVDNLLKWDERMYRIHGVESTDENEPYATWSNRLHPEDRVRTENEIAMALRGEKEFDTEFRIVRPDGEIRYLKAASRTLRAADGSATRMTGVNFDVTDRRRAEVGLLETSSLLRTVLDSAVETSIIATDPDLTIQLFNAGAERLLEYTSDEVIGKLNLASMHNPIELNARSAELGMVAGDSPDITAALIEPASLGHARDWSFVRKGGTHVTVSLVVSAMHDFAGKLLGYLGVAHDVTSQRQHEGSLREATHKAEQANRAKSEFLANMSHEIRTPMNAVIGLSYLLAQSRLDTPQRELLAKIEVSSNALLAVINDVLDLTKIEAGELLVDNDAFSPETLLRAVSDVVAMDAHAKGISFAIEIEDELPNALLGDPTRLTQILTNLLTNAVKFTERGKVSLIVRRLEDTATGTTLCFTVRDTGIGISAEAQRHLFLPFAQADASITRRYGGTGLGLSIVKSLARLLGGDVHLKSTAGVGSEFTVILSFAFAAPDALGVRQPYPPTISERALGNVRVLVVDDSDINLEVTKRILELHGAQVWLARNGMEAFERLEMTPYQFEVVLMDVQMPVLDGYQASRKIRAELGLVDLPIIALTANALSSERQRAVGAGMDDFIIKPFDALTLVSSIRRHVQVSSLQAATPIQAAPLAQAAPQRIWPEIDGIDSSDVRVRLCDDFDLFRSTLKRLIEEFSDVAMATAGGESAALETQAARMHKLCGSAGMLGADAIRKLAADTRVACVAGEFERARDLTAALAVKMQQLSMSAAPVLDRARLEAEQEGRDSLSCAETIQPQQLVDLIQLLREQSLSALQRFAAISPPLRLYMGEPLFAIMRDHIDNLRFLEAAQTLGDVKAA